MEALIHSIDGIVWECTPESFHFTFVSRQSERILGYCPDAWTTSPDFWKQHVHPEDLERALQTFREAVKSREAFTHEFRMVALEQRIVWIRNSGHVLVENGKVVGLRGIFLDVTDQKLAADKLDQLNHRLVETSRQAGMAEVATGVLHNVGNVLNSVNVTTNLLNDMLQNSGVRHVTRIAGLLRTKEPELGAFITNDPKGKLVPAYLSEIATHLQEEHDTFRRELQHLSLNVEHIKEIVAMQQSYSRVAGVLEDLSIADLISDALRMNEAAFLRHGVIVETHFSPVPKVRVDKHKVLQILINMFRNAKYAMDVSGRDDKRLDVTVTMNGDDRVKVAVKDNGIGIAPENLTRIFQHGFTTKREGHGFGLHSGALAAKEMGAVLLAHSEGSGKGATFTLDIPIAGETQKATP
jgi:PAS domain S-box-containing protein